MDDPGPTGNWLLHLLLLCALILINALLTASETAIITLNDNKIQKLAEEGHKKAKSVLKLTADPARFLATLQISTACMSFLTAAVAIDTLTAPLTAWFLKLVPQATYTALVQAAALVVIALLAACVSLVLGTLLPKRIAMQKAEPIAFAAVGLLRVVTALLRPTVWLLSAVTNLFVRLFGMDPHADEEEVTEEEIRMLVDVGEEKGVIEETQKEMINNIFEFDDIIAEEIMTPRVDVEALEADTSIEEALAIGIETGYSRLPIYEEDIDHTIGVLYMKDLLPYVGKLIPDMLSLRDFVRPTFFTPGTKRGGALFAEMTEKHIQLACVVDEYGGFAGIVTVEDLLESIVGNMQDEYDNEEEEITQLDENVFDVDGFCSIEEVNELLGVELPEGDYDTVAGFVLDQLGRIPEEDEHPVVEYDRLTLTVMAMDDRAIDRVHIEVAPLPPEEDDEDARKRKNKEDE